MPDISNPRFVFLSHFISYFLLCSGTSYSQTKIEQSAIDALSESDRSKVIILMRESTEGEDGSPISQVTSVLSTESNVEQIGNLPMLSAEVNVDDLQGLYENPDVLQVFVDEPVPPLLNESAVSVGAENLHQQGILGDGATVAVLDTGVDRNHPALAGSVVAEACFSTASAPGIDVKSLCPQGFEVSLVEGSSGICPTEIAGCKHGTHVAGIIAGHDMKLNGKIFSGIAPKAKIISVQVFSLFDDKKRCGGNSPCVLSYTSDQLRALDWLYKQRQKYNLSSINMSIGGGYNDEHCDNISPLTERIERLRQKGIATVVAAGNSKFYDGLSSPACISSTISVAGLTKTNQIDTKYTNVSTLIDIAAPGTSILSCVPGNGYITLSGTSMAAPHVAAAIALLKKNFPNETVSELESRLRQSANFAKDPRTDIKLLVLNIESALNNSPQDGEPVGMTSTDISSEGQSGSFIITSKSTDKQLKEAITESCRDMECELKIIGDDTFKLDIEKKLGTVDKTDSSIESDVEIFEKVLKGVDSSAKVFRNDLSSPF